MNADAFMPHGMCYLWRPELLWLHVLSDVTIAAAYFAIPPALVALVLRARRAAAAAGLPRSAARLPYESMFIAFGLFIVACGTTHLLAVWNVWVPSYWVSGGVKVVTAAASVATAVALPPLVPRAVELFREARRAEVQRPEIARLAAVVEHSADAIYTLSPTGVVTTWNRGAAGLFGYSAGEMVGNHVRPLLPDELAAEPGELFARVARGEVVANHETARVRKDGTHVPVSLTYSPIVELGGAISGVSAIARDITDQKRAAERDLRLATERAAREEAERMASRIEEAARENAALFREAEAGSRAKSEFLAVVSHELRTPLNAVIGYTDLLSDGVSGEVTATQRRHLDRIRWSAEHLRDLIDQVLVFARADDVSGEELQEQSIDLATLLWAVAEAVAPRVGAKPVEVRVEGEPPGQVRADRVKLKQILLNIATNAVKFTDVGEVVLRARLEGDDVVIEVEDTGIGIAPQHLERIFDPFWQVAQGLTREAEGAGLGLAVCRKLARRMGGTIDVRSAPGSGSVFVLRLPRMGAGVE